MGTILAAHCSSLRLHFRMAAAWLCSQTFDKAQRCRLHCKPHQADDPKRAIKNPVGDFRGICQLHMRTPQCSRPQDELRSELLQKNGRRCLTLGLLPGIMFVLAVVFRARGAEMSVYVFFVLPIHTRTHTHTLVFLLQFCLAFASETSAARLLAMVAPDLSKPDLSKQRAATVPEWYCTQPQIQFLVGSCN